MYHGPPHHAIDKYLLSKILFVMNRRTPKHTKVVLLGGSALTLLNIRDASFDVDLLSLNNKGDFSETVQVINKFARRGDIFIDILKDGKLIHHHPLDTNTLIQNFGTHMFEMQLPSNFEKKCHKIKRLDFVLPEGGKMKVFPTKKLLTNMELFTPCVEDIFCTKLYAGRKKDQEDLINMLTEIHLTKRYIKKRTKRLQERVLDFIECNKHSSETIKAVRIYDYLQEKYDFLTPLPQEVKEQYDKRYVT